MIKIDNIKKSFGEKIVLNNVSFEIKDSETVAIIGQSGVGKSVLLKHINGILQPDAGSILINSSNINKLNLKKIKNIKKRMSMVFQFGALFDSLTIEDNILLALNNLTNLSMKDKKIKVKEVLKKVNLDNIENLYPHDISGGMQKRVGIARAIATNPKILLYDEPTTGLDPITTDKIIKLIKGISKEGKNTTIIVTHEMKIVSEIANKVIMLYEGDIIFNGSPKELYRSNDKYIQYFVKGEKV